MQEHEYIQWSSQNSDYVVTNCMRTNESFIGKDVERNGHGILQVKIIGTFLKGLSKMTKKLKLLFVLPSFEKRSCRILVRSV
jgi:hypothetical protein